MCPMGGLQIAYTNSVSYGINLVLACVILPLDKRCYLNNYHMGFLQFDTFSGNHANPRI